MDAISIVYKVGVSMAGFRALSIVFVAFAVVSSGPAQQPLISLESVAKSKNISVKSVEKLQKLGIDLWRLDRTPSRVIVRALQKAQYEDLAKGRSKYDQLIIAGNDVASLGNKLNQAVRSLEKKFMTPTLIPQKGGIPISGAQIIEKGSVKNPKGGSGWVPLGPKNVGGRTRSIIVDRRSPNILWVGSPGGGIWKSEDAGQSFQPVDDQMGRLTVSAMAQNPAQPNNLIAGTGEGYGNVDSMQGGGLFMTRDGSTWNLVPGTDRSDLAYITGVAFDASGSTLFVTAHGGSAGIYRSTSDSREDLVQVHQSDATGVRSHPSDTRFAIAGSLSSGRSFYTTDSGNTWSESSHPAWSGRVELTYAAANPNVVYASVDMSVNGSSHGLIFKSTDGGQSFSPCGTNRSDGRRGGYMGQQGWYNNCIWAGDPHDANLVLVGGIDLWRSTDGGETIRDISTWYNDSSAHADHHAIVSGPAYDGFSNTTVYFGNDGGVAVADNVKTVGNDANIPRVSGWRRLNNGYVSTMFYDIAAASFGLVVGGTQDNGTLSTYNPAGQEDWKAIYGGDGGYCEIDETNRYVYGEYVYGSVHRINLSSEAYSSSISGNFWNGARNEWQWKSTPYLIEEARDGQGNFIAPLALDKLNPDRLYVGMNSLWRTENARAPQHASSVQSGPVWSRVKNGGYGPISAVTIDARNSDVVYVGHNNGLIFKSTDATSTNPSWTLISPSSGFPRRFCTRIVIDPSDSNTIYAAFGEFAQDNIWRSTNGGSTWESISSTLIASPVRALAIHPNHPKLIYAGTEIGFFVSDDGGATWSPTNQGPTRCSVTDLAWIGTRLVASTYGRGVFSIDLSGAQ